MKIVCYTCITGSYDKLHDPLIVPSGIDFICFTNNSNLKSNIWKIRPIPSELDNLSQVKKQRVIKICPHKFLSEYDISIWIDGNITIIGNLTNFINQYDLVKTPFYTRKHPQRKCIYAECTACKRARKDKHDIIDRVYNKYKNEKFPENIGLAETGLILRKHNDPQCKKLCDEWAKELLLNSHRDQLSFNYICWKLNIVYGILDKEPNLRKNSYFKLGLHGK